VVKIVKEGLEMRGRGKDLYSWSGSRPPAGDPWVLSGFVWEGRIH
jgi:hypothetical protein